METKKEGKIAHLLNWLKEKVKGFPDFVLMTIVVWGILMNGVAVFLPSVLVGLVFGWPGSILYALDVVVASATISLVLFLLVWTGIKAIEDYLLPAMVWGWIGGAVASVLMVLYRIILAVANTFKIFNPAPHQDIVGSVVYWIVPVAIGFAMVADVLLARENRNYS